MRAWKAVFRLTILLAVAVVVWGCGASKGSERIVLRIASWGGAGDDSDAARIQREVYAEFERLHPNVEIQLENTPGPQDYVKKMLLSFVAKAEPDIMRLDASSAAVFINNGVLLDLTSKINGPNGIELGDFFPNVVAIAKRGDAIYAIPIDFTPMVVYYNKEHFDKAGVPYPKFDWTWDDFLAAAKALTKDGKYGYTFNNWMPGWLPWIWNNDADVFGENRKATGAANSPQFVEGITWLRDLVIVHKVAPSLSQLASEGAPPFSHGEAAMETSGHWNLVGLANAPDIKLDQIGIVPIPVSRRGMQPKTVMYESGWSIGKNCRHADLAWEFIRYYTSQEVQRKIQSTGIGICARRDIATERANDPRERDFLRIVPTAIRPWGATIEEYNFVESEGQKAMDGVLKGGRDPMEAFTRFAEAVDRQMEKP